MNKTALCSLLAFGAALLASSAIASSLSSPSRPTKFPLQRPTEQGVLFVSGSTFSVNEAPFGLHQVVQVTGGGGSWYALLADGTVRQWPSRAFGWSQDQAQLVRRLRGVVQIAAGNTFAMALLSDGKVVAWGSLRITDGFSWVTANAFVPADLPKIVQISAGDNHALALTADGKVIAWGDNGKGQCDSPNITDVVQVAAGGEHSLALRGNGSVVAWGNRTFAPRDDRAIVPAGLADVVKLSAGSEHSVALLRSGRVVGWGSNIFGQAPRDFALNDAVDIVAGDAFSAVTLRNRQLRFFSTDSTPPSRDLQSVVQIAGGSPFVAVKKSRLVTWGRARAQTMSVVPDVSSVVEVDAGNDQIVVRTASGRVFAWGGVLDRAPAHMPGDLPRVVKLAAGDDYSAVVTAGGQVMAWRHDSSAEPDVDLPAGLRGIVDLAAGSEHMLALHRNGGVISWGLDGNLLPVPRIREKIKSIGIASSFNFALGVSGNLYRWGSFANTPLGRLAIVRRGVSSFAAKYHSNHLVSIDRKGRVDAFSVTGATNLNQHTTVPPGLGRAVKAAVGPTYSAVLLSNGTLRSWGRDSSLSGAMGPVPKDLKNIASFAVGRNFVAALRHANK